MGRRRSLKPTEAVGGTWSEATFLRLLARLPETGQYRSDPYGMYGGLPRNRHVSGKGGAVNWNEGLPSRGRDPLKRLQRQTKGYTKSLTMRRDSLAPVCRRLGLI